jgi:hypothetical protein
MNMQRWLYLLFFCFSMLCFAETVHYVLPVNRTTADGGIKIERMMLRAPRGSSVTLDDWWYSSLVSCYTETGNVDVVFCVDTSGSMAGAIDELYMNIGRFAHRIEAMGFDADFGLINYCETVHLVTGPTLVRMLQHSTIFLQPQLPVMAVMNIILRL